MMNSAANAVRDSVDIAQSEGEAELVPAQGIQCGDLNLAFPYAWAQAIVDDFHLTHVPNAPAWLAGAANVEGEILPVFDLARWAAAGAPGVSFSGTGADRARLLVGGQGANRAAIVFTGSARMVGYAPKRQEAVDLAAAPTQLRGVVLAKCETTPSHWVLDARRLLDKLADELLP